MWRVGYEVQAKYSLHFVGHKFDADIAGSLNNMQEPLQLELTSCGGA